MTTSTGARTDRLITAVGEGTAFLAQVSKFAVDREQTDQFVDAGSFLPPQVVRDIIACIAPSGQVAGWPEGTEFPVSIDFARPVVVVSIHTDVPSGDRAHRIDRLRERLIPHSLVVLTALPAPEDDPRQRAELLSAFGGLELLGAEDRTLADAPIPVRDWRRYPVCGLVPGSPPHALIGGVGHVGG
ncbi:class I SAM-dependent methyltransferase [Phytohabitans aurantiacus]|uniref:Uncharacterized protein n=1 Tax=Phytohabitans aurantiacus TaxID=3016789 RepID=A0ABQ5QZG1_9ACTN|nr:hypothetical protein [Phytohabitans aurantiacus]GLH99895.1 hypothetical protein Pa4123_51710 [Phytohabitans aurantiacus]